VVGGESEEEVVGAVLGGRVTVVVLGVGVIVAGVMVVDVDGL
jgi:hypothetical protein